MKQEIALGRSSKNSHRLSSEPYFQTGKFGHRRPRACGSTRYSKGITLMELMIVVAIVAIIVSLAYPTFASYVREARRGAAQELLLDWAHRQEIWRANNVSYGNTTDVPKPSHSYFTFADPTVTASTYLLTATATTAGKQNLDKERGQSCATLTLNQNGGQSTTAEEVCWGK